jgi:hypothetical protein
LPFCYFSFPAEVFRLFKIALLFIQL